MEAANFHDAQYNQMLIEENLVLTYDISCYVNNLSRPKVNLNTLIPPIIQRIASGARYNFYDYNFMQWLACSIRYTFTAPRSTTGLAQTDAVQNFIQDLTRIGGPSGAGFVWNASFGGIKAVILLKTPKTLQLDTSIYHEFFIGTMFTNRLRKVSPHFMFVYGLFKCSRPKFTKPNLSVASSFCDSTQVLDIYDTMTPQEISTMEKTEAEIDRLRQIGNYDEANNLERLLDDLYAKYSEVLDNPVNYLLIENISGGLTLSEHLTSPNTNMRDVISYLLQLSIALDYALHDSDFCHYDLHTDNIIMRHIEVLNQDSYVEMAFYGENFKRKIYTRFIPVIIDYGRSHGTYLDPVTKQKQSFGYFMYPQWGIAYDRSRPAYDLYKLVGFIAFEIFMSYRDKPLPAMLDYSNLDSMSTSEDVTTGLNTIPMSMSNYPVVTLKRSISDIEDELEAVAIARRISNKIFDQVLALLLFFPFIAAEFSNYQDRDPSRPEVSKTEIILFIIQEFGTGRFSIGDRWPQADQEPLKYQLYHGFFNYIQRMM